jgi:hypothetical protein
MPTKKLLAQAGRSGSSIITLKRAHTGWHRYWEGRRRQDLVRYFCMHSGARVGSSVSQVAARQSRRSAMSMRQTAIGWIRLILSKRSNSRMEQQGLTRRDLEEIIGTRTRIAEVMNESADCRSQ